MKVFIILNSNSKLDFLALSTSSNQTIYQLCRRHVPKSSPKDNLNFTYTQYALICCLLFAFSTAFHCYFKLTLFILCLLHTNIFYWLHVVYCICLNIGSILTNIDCLGNGSTKLQYCDVWQFMMCFIVLLFFFFFLELIWLCCFGASIIITGLVNFSTIFFIQENFSTKSLFWWNLEGKRQGENDVNQSIPDVIVFSCYWQCIKVRQFLCAYKRMNAAASPEDCVAGGINLRLRWGKPRMFHDVPSFHKAFRVHRRGHLGRVVEACIGVRLISTANVLCTSWIWHQKVKTLLINVLNLGLTDSVVCMLPMKLLDGTLEFSSHTDLFSWWACFAGLHSNKIHLCLNQSWWACFAILCIAIKYSIQID